MLVTRTRALTLMLATALTALLGLVPRQTSPAPSQPGRAPVVLVTGANRGLGLEFARQYDAAGYTVIGTARRPAEAEKLASLGARVVQLDVTDQGSVDRLATLLKGQPIDLLINNAGVGGQHPQRSIDDLDIEKVELAIQTNCIGPMRVTHALLPSLRQGDGKTIVNITSLLGSIERNTRGGYYGYRESKAALNMFTRTLAADLADDGFTCITMSPGWVKTRMGGPGARLTPEQSIGGMRKVIDDLTPKDTGKYYHWDGSELPW